MKAVLFAAVLIASSFISATPALADADATGPVIVSISPEGGTSFNGGEVVFSIQAYDEHPSQLTLTFGDADVVAPAPAYSAPETSLPTNMNATLTVDTNNLPDGAYILHVKATDTEGNATERSAQYIVDKQAPSIPTAGSPNDVWRQAQNVQFDWSAAIDATLPLGLRYDFRASQNSSDVGDAVDDSAALYRNTLGTNTVTIDNLAPGVWYWQVRSIDSAGNKSAWSTVWKVMVDDTVPELVVHTPYDQQLLGAVTSLSIEADASDANGLQEYTVLFDGLEVQTLPQPLGGAMAPVIIDLTNVVDGDHIVTVSAVDEVGHETVIERTVTIDRTSPVVETTLTNGDMLEGLVDLQIASTDFHPGSHTVTIRDANRLIVENALEEVGGFWRYAWDTTAVSDGTYTISFRSVDQVGNETTIERTVQVKNLTTAGMGTSLPSVPLVNTLDVDLSQPRLVGVVTPPVRDEIYPEKSDIDDTTTPREDMGQPDILPIQPTEGGWKLFGIMWYWWASFAGVVGATVWWARRYMAGRSPEVT